MHYFLIGSGDFIHSILMNDIRLAPIGTNQTHFIPITAVFDKGLIISSEANFISLDDNWYYMFIGGAYYY